MSRVIDHRIVEMGFENKQFNDGIRESESVLSTFQNTLKGLASGAVDGISSLSGIPQAFSGLQGIVRLVSGDFNDFGMIGVGAMLRIGEAAIDAGAKILKSLTIAPISDGWTEYEIKIGAIQTMLNSFTQAERDSGYALQEVNTNLDELNHYADKTIYSFKDMTSNIGKFTNAGVPLPRAVNAIKGISNAAALAGANTWEASRAMYNFSQALAIGYVNRIDWRSIELANMATVEFKQQLLDGAVAAGTLSKNADGMYTVLTTNSQGKQFKQTIDATKNFADSLSYQWMTADALVDVLNDYADETTEIGARATKAATELKTFSMLMDNLTETVGSGWAKTFELIFGDYDEAIELWTGIGKAVGGVLDDIADRRNALLEDWKFHGGRDTLINLFKNAWSNHLKPKFFDKIKEAWSDVFGVKDDGTRKDSLGKQLADATTRMSVSIQTFLATIKPETIEKFKDVWTGVFSKISLKIDLFRVGLSNAWRIIKLISGPILDLAALWGRAWTAFANFAKGFELFDTIGETLYVYIEWAYQGLSKFLSLVWNGEWAQGFAYIKEWFSNLPTLSEATLSAWYKITDFMKNLANTEFHIPFTKLNISLVGIWDRIKKLASDFWDWLSEKFPNLTKSIEDWFKNIDWAQIWENVKQGFKDTWAYIKAIFSGDTADKPELKWFEDLKEYFKNIDWSGIWNSIKSGFMTAVDFVKSIFTGEGIGHDFVQGIIDGIKNTWNSLFGKKDIIPESLGGGGGGSSSSAAPFSLTEGILNLEEVLGDGTYSTGIKISEKIQYIKEKLTDFTDIISDSTSGISTATGKLKNAWEWLKDIFNTIKNFFTERWDTIGGFKGIWEWLKEILKDIKDFFVNQWGEIGGLAGVFEIFKNFSLSKFFLSISSLIDNFSEKKEGSIKDFFKNFTIFIGVLTAAIIALSLIDADKAIEGSLALLAILAAFSTAYGVFQSFTNRAKKTSETAMVPFKEKVLDVAKVSLLRQLATLLVFAAAIAVIVNVLRKLAKMAEKSGELWEAMGALAVLIVGMLGVMYAISSMPQPDTSKLMLQILSLYLFVKVVKKLITPLIKLMILANWSGNLWEAMGALAVLIVGMLGVMYLMGKMDFKVSDAAKITAMGSLMKSLALSLDFLIPILLVLAFLPKEKLTQGLISLGGVLGAMVLVMASMSLIDGSKMKGMLSVAGAVLLFSLALLPITAVLLVFAALGWERAKQGLLVLGIIIAELAIAMALMQNVKGGIGIGVGLLGMAAALVILVPLLILLGTIPFDIIGTGLLAVGIAMGILVGSVLLLGLAKGDLLHIAAVMLAFGAAIFLISAGIALLILSIGALVALGATFSLAMATLGAGLANLAANFIISLGEKMPEVRAALITIVSEWLLILASQKIIFIQFLLDFLISLMEGLSERVGIIVDLFMDILINIIDALIPRVPELVTKFVQLFDAIFTAFGDAAANANTKDIADKMGIALIAVVAAFAAIKIMGSNIMVTQTLKAIANLASVGAFLAALAVVIALLGEFQKLVGLDEATLQAGADFIIALLDVVGQIINKVLEVVMGAIMTVLNSFGKGMSEFIGHLQPFLDGIKNVSSDHTKGAGWLLLLMGEMLGTTFLGFVGSFFSSRLPQFAKDVSQFWEDITPFVEGVTSLTSADLTAVDVITTSIEKLSKVSTNIASLLGLNGGLAKLGAELVEFAPYMVKYAQMLDGVDLKNAGASATIADMFANVALKLDTIKYDGLVQWFTGKGTSLSDFAEMLIPFGKAMRSYGLSVSGLDGNKVKASAIAALMLAETAVNLNEIPAGDTWIQTIGLVSKKHTLGSFADEITVFGKAMNSYSQSLGNFDIDKVSASTTAASMLVGLATELNEIPDDTKWQSKISLFASGTSLESFGGQLIQFGSAMSAYSVSVKNLDKSDIERSVAAGDMLIGLYKSLNEDTSFWTLFVQPKTLGEFGAELAIFGTSLLSFSDSIKGLDTSQLDMVSKIFEEINAINNIVYDPSNAGYFATGVDVALGNIIRTLGDIAVDAAEIGGPLDIGITSMMGSIGSFITNNSSELTTAFQDILNKLDINAAGKSLSDEVGTNIGKSLSDSLGKSVDSEKPVLKTNGGKVFMNFLEGFQTSAGMSTANKPTDNDESSFFKSLGVALATSVSKGFDSKKDTIKQTTEDTASIMENVFKREEPMFNNIGITLLENLANGINLNTFIVTSAITNTMVLAQNKMRESEMEFQTISRYLIDAFISGIDSKNQSLTNKISDMLTNAQNVIKSTYQGFAKVGSYVIDGFISGISSKVKAAAAAAANMANAASVAASKNLKVKSPSRVFYMIGTYVVEGFVNAINAMAYTAENAAEALANETINPVIKALQMIADVADDNFDYQPTITPVVDLSNVLAGTSQITEMLSTANQYSASLAGKAAIARDMTKEIQNGTIQQEPQTNNVENHFHLNNVTIREEADIDKLAEKLNAIQTRTLRGRGIKPTPLY